MSGASSRFEIENNAKASFIEAGLHVLDELLPRTLLPVRPLTDTVLAPVTFSRQQLR